MTSLLSLLDLGSAGLAAQNSGIAVAQNNVANVNTDGYSRQRVDLESLLAAPQVGGVRAGSPTRYADDLLAARIRDSGAQLGMAQSLAAGATDAATSLATAPTLDAQLAAMFAKLQQVAAAPTDSNARDAAVQAIRDVVSAVHADASAVAQARSDADKRVVDGAQQATQLANQLAAANAAVAQTGDPAARDHRDLLAKQLAATVGGSARIDPDGQMRFVLDGGAVLVDGAHAAALQTSPDPTTGLARVTVVDGATSRDVTTQIAGGSLGGDLALRDKTLAKAATGLDQLAFDLATSTNAVSTANAALDGTTGHAMFAAPAQVAGAAAALAIDPSLDASSSLLAAAAPGSGPGDNRGALALAALADQQVASGGTRSLTDAALDVVAGVAQDGATAQADVTRDQLVSDNLAGLRDSLAGVDTNQELADLARFQNASQAMTKFVSTVDSLLSTIIQNV